MIDFNEQTRGDEEVLPGFRPRSVALTRPPRPARYLPVRRLQACAAVVEEALRAGDVFLAKNVALRAEVVARSGWQRVHGFQQQELPL